MNHTCNDYGEKIPADFEREAALAFGVIQRDRHRSVEPYEWFGRPSDEACPSGRGCKCDGCAARFATEAGR